MENGLVIGGTLFQQKDIHKLIWISPNGKAENQIDHVMINQKWRRSLFDVRARRGADVGSDHHLVQADLKLKLRSGSPQCQTRLDRYNVNLLRDMDIANKFTVEVKNRFQVLEEQHGNEVEDTIQEKWHHVKKAYQSASESTLGFKKRKHKEWISTRTLEYVKQRKATENKISQTISERQKGRLRVQYAELNKLVKKSARADKRQYIEDLAEEAD